MTTGSHIDTITFDLWNTLLAHDEFYDADIRRLRTEGILRALKDEGLDVSMDDVERAYVLSDGRLSERWSVDLDVDLDEQLAIFLDCMGLERTPRLMRAIDEPYADAVLKCRPFVVEGACDVVKEMGDRGFKVALISNTSRTPGRSLRKVMHDYGLLNLFDRVVFSNEVGYLKPHREIFQRALSSVGAMPERSVHIGDHSILDVLGARRAGMRCIQVTRYAHKDDRLHKPDIYAESLKDVPDAVSVLQR